MALPLGVLIVMILILSATRASDDIKTVHVIFSCHLDIGFNGIYPEPGLDSNVINKYFHVHFPKAIQVAQELRDRGGQERLVFLTHSYLASLYLDCPAQIGIKCPYNTKAFEEAVERGDLTWHAMPYNANVEVFDPQLLEFGLQLTRELDKQFGLPPKQTMSQRDVPGLTRAAIPILHAQGVRALSVGVNPGSAPPGVPKNRPFWWKDEPSGKALLAFWHPGGYSGVPVDSRGDCVQVEGFGRALCLSWRNDNAGPPSADEVVEVFRRVQEQFPGAKVVASTFDEFVEPLLEAAPSLDLPVVTGEIGDTWIHGTGSDPGKLAEYRTLLRIRNEASSDKAGDPQFWKFSRLLLKVPEHTWGVDIKTDFGDFENWSNKNFHAQLANNLDNYKVTVNSWIRQREYNLWAVQELGESDVAIKAWKALGALQSMKDPPSPSEPDFKQADLSEPLAFSSEGWDLELDPRTGAIVGMQPRPPVSPGIPSAAQHSSSSSGVGSRWPRLLAWLGVASRGEERRGAQKNEAIDRGRLAGEGAGFASRGSPLAQIVYSSYSEDDYNVIWDEYAYINDRAEWFYKDFGKPNATVKGGARRTDLEPKLEAVWQRQSEGGGLHLITQARFPAAAVEEAGAPQAIWTEIRSPADSRDVFVDVIWENKTATRLPETLWVRWRPDPASVKASSWVMHKLGQPISPLEVILNGSHALHAVGDEGVSVQTADGKSWLSIRSLDAGLVSPGSPTPFARLSVPPDLEQGMSFALTNNIWGTDFPMWTPYHSGDANMRFRFVIQLGGEQSRGGDGGTAAE